jgi:hypothetical protein
MATFGQSHALKIDANNVKMASPPHGRLRAWLPHNPLTMQGTNLNVKMGDPNGQCACYGFPAEAFVALPESATLFISASQPL